MELDTNILKMHLEGVPNLKKTFQKDLFVSTGLFMLSVHNGPPFLLPQALGTSFDVLEIAVLSQRKLNFLLHLNAGCNNKNCKPR